MTRCSIEACHLLPGYTGLSWLILSAGIVANMALYWWLNGLDPGGTTKTDYFYEQMCWNRTIMSTYSCSALVPCLCCACFCCCWRACWFGCAPLGGAGAWYNGFGVWRPSLSWICWKFLFNVDSPGPICIIELKQETCLLDCAVHCIFLT